MKRSIRYELLTCAFKGHAIVGTEAAVVTADDELLVRELDGRRWHRCLRCDDWIVRPVPQHADRERVEKREEIQLPARGKALRDRIILRVIAVDRALHVIVFGFLAVALFTFATKSSTLHRDYLNIMNDLSGGDPGSTQVRGILGYFRKAFTYSPPHLVRLGLIVSGYALLEGVEMVGLWKYKRWAEYLTSVAVAAFIPLEVYELSNSVSVLKLVAFIINILVLVYLLFAKRLFGLRGGHAAEQERTEASSGWASFDAAEVSSADASVTVRDHATL